MKPAVKVLYFILILLLARSASALILFGLGNDPVRDGGWPEGSLAVANLKCRVAWWEGPPYGGGEWHFLYRGNTAAFVEALTGFAAIRWPEHELVIHDGPEIDGVLKLHKPDDARVDWTFTVWNPESWNQLYNNPNTVFAASSPNFRQPVSPPRIDVYIGGGLLDWTNVTIPAGVRVRDERASAAGVNPSDGAVVRVFFVDMATSKPVAGAHVALARRTSGAPNVPPAFETVSSGISDASGRAQLERIPIGSYRVSVTAEGYADRLLGYENIAERTFKQYYTELAGTADIHGKVTDGNGNALKGVRVRATNTMGMNGRGYNTPDTKESVTDVAGVFFLSGLPAGYTRLRCSADGYYDGDISTVYEVPSQNIAIHITRAGSLVVSVIDIQGNAVAKYEGHDVLVRVEPKDGLKVGSWGGNGKLKDDGTYEFMNVPPGEYVVTARPNPARTSVEYTTPQVVEVEPAVRTAVKLIMK